MAIENLLRFQSIAREALKSFHGHSHIISLDIGTRRIGLACTNVLQTQVFPLESISTAIDTPITMETLLPALKRHHLSFKSICGVVVGLPLTIDGSHGKQAQFTTKHIAKLSLPILLLDERFTTQLARKQRFPDLDNGSAVILLRDYLAMTNPVKTS